MLSYLKNIVFLSFLIFPLYSYSNDKKIDVVTSNFPPYSFKKNDKQTGYITELVKYSLKNLDYKVQIKELPYKRAINKASNTKNTIIYPLAKTKKNMENFIWISEISKDNKYLFKLKSRKDIKINTFHDLKKYKIGVKRGSYNIDYLKDNGIEKIEELTDTIQSILMLSSSRLDLILLEDLEFFHSLENYNKINFFDFEKVKDFNVSKNKNNLYIAINKNSDSKFIKDFINSFKKSLNSNKLLEVANWWTEKIEESAINVYKEALHKKGYIWVDYTLKGGSGEKMQEVLKIREKSKRKPHATQTYLGKESLGMFKKGELINLNNIAKKENWKEKLPLFINEAIQYKGNYFAVPLNIQRVNWLWLNKKIFEISKAKIPKTLEEFYKACKKIKKAGFTPLAIGNEPWQIGTLFENLVLSIGGIDFYKKTLVDLDIVALQSVKMLDIFKNLRKMQEFTDQKKEVKSWIEVTNSLKEKKASMYVMGDWVKNIFLNENIRLKDDVFLAFSFPNTQDVFLNNTDVFVFQEINKNSIKAQENLAKIIMEDIIQEKFNIEKGSLPANQNSSMKNFDKISKKSIEVFKKGNIVPSFNFRQSVSKEIRDEVINLISEFYNSPMKEETAINRIIEIIKKNKKG